MIINVDSAVYISNTSNQQCSGFINTVLYFAYKSVKMYALWANVPKNIYKLLCICELFKMNKKQN